MSKEISRLNNRFKPFYTNFLSLKNDPIFFALNGKKNIKKSDSNALIEVSEYMRGKLDDLVGQNEPIEHEVISTRL